MIDPDKKELNENISARRESFFNKGDNNAAGVDNPKEKASIEAVKDDVHDDPNSKFF